MERDYIIYSHDLDGNFTYLSPSVVNALGYSQEEFMGHYADYLTDSPIKRTWRRIKAHRFHDQYLLVAEDGTQVMQEGMLALLVP